MVKKKPVNKIGKNKNDEISFVDDSVIDLTLSDEESSVDLNKKERVEASCKDCPFNPPINISGNVLDCRAHQILLNPAAWFTDDLVNAFFSILQWRAPRTFVFSSFFYTALQERGQDYCRKHWLKDFNVASSTGNLERVLFPINSGGSHWVLVIWTVQAGKMEYFDSLMNRQLGFKIMKNLKSFFNSKLDESVVAKEEEDDDDDDDSVLEKLLSKLTISPNQVEIKDILIPKGQLQQTDGSSCGPFCCFNAQNEKEEKKDIYEFRSGLIDFFVQFLKEFERQNKTG